MMQPGLVFGFGEVLVAIDAGHRDRTVRPRRQQSGTPSDERGGGRHGRDRVTQVVLAVAERPLSVFPRFAPMNGRQRDQQNVLSSAERVAPTASSNTQRNSIA